MPEFPCENNNLTNQIDDFLSTFNLIKRKPLLRGFLYSTAQMELAVIMDHDICNQAYPFSYSEYTKEQNEIVFSCSEVFRFVVDNEADFLEMKETLPNFRRVL